MIVLDHDYCIEADGYQYILYKEGEPDKKGRIPKIGASYHPTLDMALQRYYRLVEASLIEGSRNTLVDAIKAVRALQSEIEALRKDIREVTQVESL